MEHLSSYLLAYGALIVANAPYLIGVILPPFIQILNKDIPHTAAGERIKSVVALTVCFLAAVLLDWNKITLGTPQDAFIATGIVFVESEMVYRLYFKNSLLQEKVTNLFNKSEVTEETLDPVSQ